MPDSATDRWLDWLVRGRDAGDVEVRHRTMAMLLPIRDEILDKAGIRPGDTVLDVGTGEGLLGVGALPRVGETGRVVFTDVSAPLLDTTRGAVTELGATDRSCFQVTPAETLAGIPDGSVDVVLTRSVLIYVTERRAAFGSFARVLRPGGRICLYEPLASFFLTEDDSRGSFFGWDVGEAAAAAAARVQEVYRRPGDHTASPMLTLSAQELVHDAEGAGFGDLTATLTATSRRHDPGDETLVRRTLHGRPNPDMPSPAEAAREVLSAEDADDFLAALELAVRAGRGRVRQASVLVRGTAAGPRG
jgi:SAM-dependent methyltransferase